MNTLIYKEQVISKNRIGANGNKHLDPLEERNMMNLVTTWN